MAQTATWVNPVALRRLRERVGLTPEKVESESRRLQRRHFAFIERKQLEEWEAGRSTPDLEHLETLAQLYRCPVGYFFLDSVPEEHLSLSFRGLSQGKELQFDTTTRQNLHRFLELANWFADSLESAGVKWDVSIPRYDLADLRRESTVVRERAHVGFYPEVRSQWTLPNEAFEWWRRKIEDMGVFCLALKLHPAYIRGASIWLRGKYPFILVNRQDAEADTGRLFTLLHEYAHLIVSRGRSGVACDFTGRKHGRLMEKAANMFAARLLLQPQELWEYLRQINKDNYNENWSDSELTKIARKFFVSRDVICIMLEELKLAPRHFYQRKRAAWDKRYREQQQRFIPRGRKLKKWEMKAIELGRTGIRVLVSLAETDALSLLDAAEILETKVEKVQTYLEEFARFLRDD